MLDASQKQEPVVDDKTFWCGPTATKQKS